MKITWGKLRHLLREEASNLPKQKGWYHVSVQDLGDEFTFTPRHPSAPFVDDDLMSIEDWHTLRTSWAPNINRALEALHDLYSLDSKRSAYVYYVPSLPGDVDLESEFNGCPESPDNEYGTDFSYKKYKDYVATTSGHLLTPDEMEDELTHCVPDAPETGEHWATKPVIAPKIGTLRNGQFIPSSSRKRIG